MGRGGGGGGGPMAYDPMSFQFPAQFYPQGPGMAPMWGYQPTPMVCHSQNCNLLMVEHCNNVCIQYVLLCTNEQMATYGMGSTSL